MNEPVKGSTSGSMEQEGKPKTPSPGDEEARRTQIKNTVKENLRALEVKAKEMIDSATSRVKETHESVIRPILDQIELKTKEAVDKANVYLRDTEETVKEKFPEADKKAHEAIDKCNEIIKEMNDYFAKATDEINFKISAAVQGGKEYLEERKQIDLENQSKQTQTSDAGTSKRTDLKKGEDTQDKENLGVNLHV